MFFISYLNINFPLFHARRLSAGMAPVVVARLVTLVAGMMSVLVRATPHPAEHLINSLFVFNDTACESDSLHMRCPHGTAIDVQFAQFGRLVSGKQLCPALNVRPGEPYPHEDTNCLSSSSLTIVLDLCQNQRQCKVTADTSTFGEDPCPGTTKYLKVAYRCKPNEFQTRETCEGEEMILKCTKNKRIAVFSAMFGRSGQGHVECPDQRHIGRVCKSSIAQKKVVDACHGHKLCNIPSDVRIFGDPCIPGTSKYLQVVFACVPKRIMKTTVTSHDDSQEYDDEYRFTDEYQVPPGGAQPEDGLAGPVERKERVGPGVDRELGYVPKQSTNDHKIPVVLTTPTAKSILGRLSNNEKLILYIVVGVLGICLIIMVIVISKLVHDKRKKSKKSNKHSSVPDSMDKPCDTMLNLSPSSENTYSHHITTPADSFLDHSTDLNDTLDIMQYNLRSLTSQPPTLSRPATSTLTRAHSRDSPNRAFHSDPANIRSINNYYG